MTDSRTVCSARIPAAALPALATLRCRADIQAVPDGDRLWLHWQPDDTILRLLLPIPGIELYFESQGRWHRIGQRLPVEPPPREPAQRLDRLIVPDRLDVVDPPATVGEPVRLVLVRDTQPRQATAVLCSIAALHAWAISATSRELAVLRAARHGDQVLVLGEKPPLLTDGERLWGRRVLTPLGHRVEPALPENALAEAIGLQAGEIALLRHDGIDIVPEDAFITLSRAAVRLAGGEDRP